MARRPRKRMACYDSVKDEIHGCEPGTLTYFHEEGHRQQTKTGFLMEAELYMLFLVMLSFGVIVAISKNLYAIIPMVFALATYLYIEVEAWGFAIGKWWRK